MNIQKILAELEALSADQFSGLVLLRDGTGKELVWTSGQAQRNWNIPIQRTTRFRLASVSKLWTAVAVLRLVEQGHLQLAAPISRWLDLAGTQIDQQITLAQLLSMTAGIADWFEESADWEAAWAALRRSQPLYLLQRNADYLPLFAHKPALAAPGSTYQYNNASYILLGMIIEACTAAPFATVIEREVLTPAGMNTASMAALDGPQSNLAEGYLPPHPATPDQWRSNIYTVTPTPVGDGGAFASADDLLAFWDALHQRRLLGDELTQALLRPVSMDGHFRGYTWMYGYGMQFLLAADGSIVRYGHTGEEDGVSCRVYHYPQRQLDLLVLGNQSWCAGDVTWRIHASLD